MRCDATDGAPAATEDDDDDDDDDDGSDDLLDIWNVDEPLALIAAAAAAGAGNKLFAGIGML
jgi:hypothetical protein